jgi:hypothetical protein
MPCATSLSEYTVHIFSGWIIKATDCNDYCRAHVTSLGILVFLQMRSGLQCVIKVYRPSFLMMLQSLKLCRVKWLLFRSKSIRQSYTQVLRGQSVVLLLLYTAADEADDLLLSNPQHQDLLPIGLIVSAMKNRGVVCLQPVQQIYNALN